LGHSSDARKAWEYALGLTADPALRLYLVGRIAELGDS
jgi:hypothetical protein